MAPRGRGRGDRTLLGRARRTFAKFEFEFLFVFFAGAFYLLCKYWLYVSAMARPAPLSLTLLKTYSFRPLTPSAISIAALLAFVRSFGRSVNRRGSTSTWRRTRWYCQTSRTRDRETKARKVICIFTHYIPNKEWLGLAPLTPRCPAGRTREGRSWASRAETRERGREKWVDGSAPHPACRHLRRGLTCGWFGTAS